SERPHRAVAHGRGAHGEVDRRAHVRLLVRVLMSMFKLPKTPPEDMFRAFPAENAELWPKERPEKQSTDAFNEFDAEDQSSEDRWLAVARSQQLAPLKVPPWPPLAVAAVVLSLFTPAAIISTLI